MSTPAAVIYDCEGPRLSDEERAFFKDVNPLGFIVFARHCRSREELRAHCDELRDVVGRDDAPILIDQEGGRVARMQQPAFPAYVAPAKFGDLWRLDPAKAQVAIALNASLIARLLMDCGVNVNCVPMLDVPQSDTDPVVIGDRACAKHHDTIADLGGHVIAGTLAGGAAPIIKHLPGHGRALCDSHYELPRVSAEKSDLQDVDFVPFKALNTATMGMTGHVVYDAYDPERPATLSPIVVNEVIRGEIGFDGLLFTDDLRMQALSGPMDKRVEGAYEAGCDIALCCNFTMDEKMQSRDVLRPVAGKTAERAAKALTQISAPNGHKGATQDDYARLAELLKPVLSAPA